VIVRASAWDPQDVDIDEVVPRSYYIYDPNQFREFLNDYVLNTSRSIIVRYSASFTESEPTQSKRPSLEQVTVAMRVCNRFLSRYAVEHERVTQVPDPSLPLASLVTR